MEQRKTSPKIAGIDIGKQHLDIAGHGSEDEVRFVNNAAGFAMLDDWLAQRGVRRVGLEASGGYETGVCRVLQDCGFETVLHQPLEVCLFARLKRKRAESDRLDARLIAAATAQVAAVKAAADLLAQARTHREHTRLADLRGLPCCAPPEAALHPRL